MIIARKQMKNLILNFKISNIKKKYLFMIFKLQKKIEKFCNFVEILILNA